MKTFTALAFALAATIGATAAQAAHSDYLLEIKDLKGNAAEPLAVDSWSFGVCNSNCSSGSSKRTIVSPRDVATGQASGKRQHQPVRVQASQNSQSLRESPSKASDGKTTAVKGNWDLATNKGARTAGANDAVGDLDADGTADLAFVSTQAEISNLSLTYQKIPMEYVAVCRGKHFDKAVLRSTDDQFEITDAAVTCTSARQTQGSSFGERCVDGTCTDQGPVTMTITGGQMKHTKTGHVTLLK